MVTKHAPLSHVEVSLRSTLTSIKISKQFWSWRHKAIIHNTIFCDSGVPTHTWTRPPFTLGINTNLYTTRNAVCYQSYQIFRHNEVINQNCILLLCEMCWYGCTFDIPVHSWLYLHFVLSTKKNNCIGKMILLWLC